MNKSLKIFTLIAVGLLFANCNKSDDSSSTPLRDYQTQYDTEANDIEEFLKTNSYTIVNHPGFADDQDVIFTAIPEDDDTTVSIWDSGDLLEREVTANEVVYKIYYLKFRNGGGASGTKPSPCNVDAVLAAYKGMRLYRESETVDGVTESVLKTSIFEYTPYPQTNFPLTSVVQGWNEIFPQFKAGDFTTVTGQPTVYTDFGAGVMFIPSGLGYYATPRTNLPAYSTMIFNFKLYEVERLDQDGDGIESWREDIDGDGYIKMDADGNYSDDTDGDNVPDYADVDDDGDGKLTKVEIRNSAGVTYDFDLIPTCPGGTKKRYLDPNCFEDED